MPIVNQGGHFYRNKKNPTQQTLYPIVDNFYKYFLKYSPKNKEKLSHVNFLIYNILANFCMKECFVN